jgi:hypothetical protein
MTNQQPSEHHSQKAKAGRDATIVGRDYTSSKTVNFWIPLVFLGVIAFGALAWAVNAGLLNGSGNPQQTPTSSQTQ